MKGFIIKKDEAGEYAIPVSNIRKIAIFHIANKWRVQIDFFNGTQSYMGAYEAESEAREFYNYCLKQIAEWQDNGGENG